MADVYSIVFTILGFLVVSCGLNVWTALVFPAPVQRCRSRLEEGPFASFLLGAVYAGVFGGLGIAALSAPSGGVKIFGAVLFAPLMIGLAVGGAGLSTLLAERMRALQEGASPFGLLVRGSLINSLAALFPFIGWFLFIPVAGLISLGAGLTAVIIRPHRRPAPMVARTAPSAN